MEKEGKSLLIFCFLVGYEQYLNCLIFAVLIARSELAFIILLTFTIILFSYIIILCVSGFLRKKIEYLFIRTALTGEFFRGKALCVEFSFFSL